jgi:hypothetical protein
VLSLVLCLTSISESATVQPTPTKPSVASTVGVRVPVFNIKCVHYHHPLLSPICNRTLIVNSSAAQKFKWTGELYMETGLDRAERLCNVMLSEPTDARPLGIKLSDVYNSDASVLRLKKFHDMPDLYILLGACGPVQQCCKFSHANDVDFHATSTLSGWMTRTSQVNHLSIFTNITS